jgi:hypothetical protein
LVLAFFVAPVPAALESEMDTKKHDLTFFFTFYSVKHTPVRATITNKKSKNNKKKLDRVSLCPFHFQVLLEPGQRKKLVPIFFKP